MQVRRSHHQLPRTARQSKIEKEGYSKKAAGAILANSTRNASKAAEKANPRLKRVKGK